MYRPLNKGELEHITVVKSSRIRYDDDFVVKNYPSVSPGTPGLEEKMRIRLNNEYSSLTGMMDDNQMEKWLGTTSCTSRRWSTFQMLEDIWNNHVRSDPYNGIFSEYLVRPTCPDELDDILNSGEPGGQWSIRRSAAWLPVPESMWDVLGTFLEREAASGVTDTGYIAEDWNAWIDQRTW